MQNKLENLAILIGSLILTWHFMVEVWGVWQVAIIFATPFLLLEIACYISTLLGDKKCSKK